MIPHASASRSPWSVGVEEELFVLDAETLEPRPVPRAARRRAASRPSSSRPCVELNTGICADAAAGRRGARRAAARGEAPAAAEHGLALAAAGTWPTAVSEEQPITPDEGYRAFVDYAGPSARRQYCSGLHVHVGVASPEECLQRLEAVLPWLPARARALGQLAVRRRARNRPRLDPRGAPRRSSRGAGAPPVFASYADWERFAERLVELGLADDITRIWWDVRPHPRFGTLEMRMPDQPTRLEATAAFAALLQALVAAAEPGPPPADRGLYAQNRWAALRFGVEAELVHPDDGRLAPCRAPRRAARAARPDGDERVRPLRALDQAGEQLELGRRDGLRSLRERLVALT